jgi:hypothetical protein
MVSLYERASGRLGEALGSVAPAVAAELHPVEIRGTLAK